MTFYQKLFTLAFGFVFITIIGKAQIKKNNPGVVDRAISIKEQLQLLDSTFYFSSLEKPLKIWVHLPKNYAKHKKRYPVIYLPNNEFTFKENSFSSLLLVTQTLDSLEAIGKRTAIVVGIDSKLQEQYLYKNSKNEKDSLAICNAYVNFLADSLKPFIDKNYRTFSDRVNTLIAGATFNANLSYFAFLNRNECFAKAGLFSPEFESMPSLKTITDSLAEKVSGKLFYYYCEKEDSLLQNSGESIILSLGESSNAVIYSLMDSEEVYNLKFWTDYFSAFIIWALADGNNSIIDIKK